MGVFVQTRIINFNINFCIVLLCSLALVLYILHMIRERHVILKAALHFRLASCLVVASYIIAVLPSIL